MKKNILLLESFYTGSHKRWADELKSHSTHNIKILSLAGRHWKWRMHGSAISFANELKNSALIPDLFLITDMTDLSVFRALTNKEFPSAKYFLYFHENQITYPWSVTDSDPQLKRDNHYGFINYHSALAADKVFFNSNYHRNIFLESLHDFLLQFPDHQNIDTIKEIEEKSQVLPLGISWTELQLIKKTKKVNNAPSLLWNHRWEYDKNPDLFFNSLIRLKNEGNDFSLIVLGEKTQKYPSIFDEVKKLFADNIIHFGYCKSKDAYYELLAKADFLPVCSHQDFFGYSIVEAIALGVHPILPYRLSYPEHIQKENWDSVFYDSDEEFYLKLKECLSKPKLNLSSGVAKYDWNELIDRYDQMFIS